MPITQDTFRDTLIAVDQADALNQWGFPDYMSVAFLLTAEETSTIVSSRPPGGVGTGLIEAGYDLKGFHIKAKSCNWGPMAGFICQLPFLNKEGYSKIGFNTNSIVDYLNQINQFGSIQAQLDSMPQALLAVRAVLEPLQIAAPAVTVSVNPVYVSLFELLLYAKNEVDRVISLYGMDRNGALTPDDKTAIYDNTFYGPYRDRPRVQNLDQAKLDSIRNNIYRIFEKGPVNIKEAYRKAEYKTATWSGDNAMPAVAGAPFTPLKRAFSAAIGAAIAEVRLMTGVVAATVVAAPPASDDTIVGMAVNNVTEENSTILVNFRLKRLPDTEVPAGKALWGIYYDTISYRSNTGSAFAAGAVDTYTNSLAPDKVLSLALKAKLRKQNGLEYNAAYDAYVQARKASFATGLTRIFAGTSASAEAEATPYYPVNGIMNPHPPYAAVDNPQFYKNAVSDDFDLFAFWPDAAKPMEDLIRPSEAHMDLILKYMPRTSRLFYLEFIPGFDELVDENGGNLKESAEEGNIHNLGRLAAGTLNSFALDQYRVLHGEANNTSANKAFHSDEGGRPGIMEVEFPVAFFLPKVLPAPTPFPGKRGGLVKNPTEFLALMLASIAGGYRVVMHSEWMIHFFYISMPKTDRDVFRNALADEGKKREFQTLEENHAKLYGGPGQPAFVETDFANGLQNLMALSPGVFLKLRTKFLELASQGNVRAIERKISVETLVTQPVAAPGAST